MAAHTVEHMDTLTNDDTAILDFERNRWKHAGAKETAIRETFGVSATTYYARLNDILDNPAALTHDPIHVRRLLRLRTARKRARTSPRVHAARRLEFLPFNPT